MGWSSKYCTKNMTKSWWWLLLGRGGTTQPYVLKNPLVIPSEVWMGIPQEYLLSHFGSWNKEVYLVGANHPHLVATLSSSFSRENGHLFLICSSRSAQPSWIWVFPKIGVPQNGWFIRENSIRIDDLVVPLFKHCSLNIRTIPQKFSEVIACWKKSQT